MGEENHEWFVATVSACIQIAAIFWFVYNVESVRKDISEIRSILTKESEK